MIWEHNTDQLFFTLTTADADRVAQSAAAYGAALAGGGFGTITTEIGPP